MSILKNLIRKPRNQEQAGFVDQAGVACLSRAGGDANALEFTDFRLDSRWSAM
jgi:hypothetical protein